MAASTKKSAKASPSKSPSKSKAKPATSQRSKHFTKTEDEDLEGSEYASDAGDTKAKQYDSDALDDDSDDEEKPSPKKRKRASPRKSTKTRSPRKKSKTADESEEEFVEVEDGQEVVGIVVQAPKTGRGEFLVYVVSCHAHCCSVPPGQVSQNTFDFLTQLTDPENNDRTW